MITIIAAIANNNVLGKDNQLIWHIPADLKRFKKETSGHHIIMGRKTYESLGRPLPNRVNVVISRNMNYPTPTGCVVVDSLEKALEIAKNDANPFIIGGAQIYAEAMNIADKLDLTHVHHDFDGDVFFPLIDSDIWEETSREDFEADGPNSLNYSFVTYERRN